MCAVCCAWAVAKPKTWSATLASEPHCVIGTHGLRFEDNAAQRLREALTWLAWTPAAAIRQTVLVADYGLILAGGLALGAYQRGCIDHLLGQPDLTLRAITGLSIGAINGAIVAGNPPERRAERLASFWSAAATDSFAEGWIDPTGLLSTCAPRKALNWLNVVSARALGSPALFRPRGLLEPHPSQVQSF
jgi:hypothetical protein